MSKLKAITPPVWIFALTLLAIIATGGLVGTTPCDRMVRGCQADAVATHPGNAALQQAYAARCAERPCSVDKSSALIPLSLLVLGAVMFGVCLRQRGSGWAGESPVPDSAADALPLAADVVEPAVEESAAAPEVPPYSEAKDLAASVAADPGPAAAGAGLTAEQREFCLQALQGGEEPSKEMLCSSLGRLLGSPDPQLWKSAPLGDLELLVRILAVGALSGPETSKYQAGLRESQGDALHSAVDGLEEKTKKALHEDCLEMLRRDLRTSADRREAADGAAGAALEDVVQAASAEAALAGLSRCSKAALVHLAAFLRVAR